MPAVGEIIACDIDISILYAAPWLTSLLHTVNASVQGRLTQGGCLQSLSWHHEADGSLRSTLRNLSAIRRTSSMTESNDIYSNLDSCR